MRRFLFEEKEHRVSISFRRGGKIPESASSLNRLIRQIAGRSKGGSGSGGFAGRGAAGDSRRNCVVKTRYSDSMAAHLHQINKYLTREGTDREGGAAELYGTDIAEYKANMTDRNFRVFLSPQNGNTDLTALTKSFVKRLELDTGYKIYWEAANHYNTDHPHSHLIINGKDRDGREVKFSKDLVKTFMRENARDICTAMTGSRSMNELAMEREAALTANRKIPFDREIKERMNGTLCVNLDGIKDRSAYVKRLDHLKKIGLAEFAEGRYKLNHKWEETLAQAGRCGCFLSARDALRFTDRSKLNSLDTNFEFAKLRLIHRMPEEKREEYRKETERAKEMTRDADAKEKRKAVYAVDKKYGINVFDEVVKKGVVSKVYTIGDDESRSHAVLLESVDGKAYFIPLLDKPDVKEGQFVKVTPARGQNGRLAPDFAEVKEKHLVMEAKKYGYNNRLTQYIERKEKERVLRKEREGIEL
jgi:hypothetical protein